MRANVASAKLLRLGCIEILLCVAAIAAWAEPVQKEQAARVANAWYQLRFRGSQDLKAGKAEAMMVFTGSDARAIVVKARVIAYAFDTPAGGCIAIAVDDEMSPIVFYSPHESLTVPAVPPAQAILDGIAERMAERRDAHAPKTGRHPFWDKLSAVADPKLTDQPSGTLPLAPVGPHLTTIWNQRAPYNDQCPLYQGERCLTGCTSIAMAQIMRYWRHPIVGTGSHSYFWELGGRTLSANFGSTTYDWANMPNQLTTSSSQAAKDAVSLLCYHCGVSVSTQYSPDGSSGWFYGDPLTQYFGYKTTREVERSSYTLSGWFDLMRQQVNMGQPVWYSVTREGGGHALVLDGHDSPSLVHLNMGWGGAYDGWYTIDHFPTDRNYESRGAIIDIRPDRPALSLSRTSLSNSVEQGKNAPSQSFDVWNSESGTLTYSIVDNVGWLSCIPTSGSSTGEHDKITVDYATSGLALGTYSAEITVSALGATNSPQTIRVTLTVVPGPPIISVAPFSVTNTCVQGKNAPGKTFEIWNAGGGTLTYSIESSVPWLTCNPADGTSSGEHDTIEIAFSTSALVIGSYSATITISAPGVENSPQLVQVSLTVIPPPMIARSPVCFFPACQEGANAPSQVLQVWNSGGEVLDYSLGANVAWLALDPTSGASTGEHDSITVSYTSSQLAPGTYLATITISAPGAANSPLVVGVTLTVWRPAPSISFSQTFLSNSCDQGTNAPAQSFEVWNSGFYVLDYSISDNATWLSCSPDSGTSTTEHDTILVDYETAALPPGEHNATITVTDTAAENSPQVIPVSLFVEEVRPVWYVHGGVTFSGDGLAWVTAFKTIQEGIEAASEGDTVKVAEGAYVEMIHFSGKSIKVTGTNPFNPSVVANTVIDGGGAGSTVTFAGTENQTCVLSGFTIRNGNAFNGGGICGGAAAQHTLATIRNNVLENNTGQYGAAICWCDGNVENNLIQNNSAARYGGGLFDCDGAIRNNLIGQNTAQKYGGGASNCGGEIDSTTFVANSALENAGGGLYLCAGGIAGCIIWGNVAPTGAQTANSSVPCYSCIEAWTQGGDGNIALDPRFNAPGVGDYRLSPDSPCIDSGLNKLWMELGTDLDGKPRVLLGASSLTVDMGAYEYGSVPFEVIDVVRMPGAGLRLTWRSRPGQTYVVQACTDLCGGSWAEVATVFCSGCETSWTDPQVSSKVKFYRVEMK